MADQETAGIGLARAPARRAVPGGLLPDAPVSNRAELAAYAASHELGEAHAPDEGTGGR
jgi:hypothetical protein